MFEYFSSNVTHHRDYFLVGKMNFSAYLPWFSGRPQNSFLLDVQTMFGRKNPSKPYN